MPLKGCRCVVGREPIFRSGTQHSLQRLSDSSMAFDLLPNLSTRQSRTGKVHTTHTIAAPTRGRETTLNIRRCMCVDVVPRPSLALRTLNPPLCHAETTSSPFDCLQSVESRQDIWNPTPPFSSTGSLAECSSSKRQVGMQRFVEVIQAITIQRAS
jgi:hypothetical protein